jgi:pimeloyl-ACP methyl ester carboxylesterase
MDLGGVARRAGVVTGIAAGVAGALYAGERAVAARIRRGGPDEVSDDPLVPEIDDLHRIATHDGGELYVIERRPSGPAGTPIVLAHGITLTSQVWARQFRSLSAAGHRVVAFDSRGHGESTVGTSGHSIENLAADLATVLEALDLHDAILVGHSMGGMAVQAFAVHQRAVLDERVRGLVLLSTSPRSFASGARRITRGVDVAAGAVPDVSALFRQRNLGLLMARLGFGDDPDPRCVEATRQMLGGCSRETVRDAGRMLVGFGLVDELPTIEVPTLVIVGSADLLTPPRDSRTIADLVPDSEFVEFAGAGHMLMYERTEELDWLVLDFADRVAPRTGADRGVRDRSGVRTAAR